MIRLAAALLAIGLVVTGCQQRQEHIQGSTSYASGWHLTRSARGSPQLINDGRSDGINLLLACNYSWGTTVHDRNPAALTMIRQHLQGEQDGATITIDGLAWSGEAVLIGDKGHMLVAQVQLAELPWAARMSYANIVRAGRHLAIHVGGYEIGASLAGIDPAIYDFGEVCNAEPIP